MAHILVVENDASVRKLFTKQLSRSGFEVDQAKDGVEAIERVVERKPDLILLDLLLPKRDGFDTLKLLRSKKDFKEIPVLIVTNVDSSVVREECERYEHVDYLLKHEIEMDDLIDKINDILL